LRERCGAYWKRRRDSTANKKSRAKLQGNNIGYDKLADKIIDG
jgi:hypothetical protein